jgi:exopolysaccharide biosynthesis polyprenyl glycosylphosphotransferase
MKTYRKALLLISDLLGFAGGFCLFILISFGSASFWPAAKLHALPLAGLTAIWLIVFFIFNFYDLERTKPNLVFLKNYGIAAMIMLGLGFAYFYINPVTAIAPKTNLLIFEAVSLALVLGLRRLAYALSTASFQNRFAIICADERHQALIDETSQNPHLGFHCIGVFKDFASFHAASPDIDLLIVHKTAAEDAAGLEKVLASKVDVLDLAEAYELILYKIPVDFINSHWVIHSIKKQGRIFYNAISRIISILFAIVVLIVTSPISLGIMIAIKIEDGGHIIFKNDRVGLHGKTFYLYKFRSMIVNAERHGAEWAQVNDARITRVGQITRKLHIDEIPQMINLLKGDLTLVGPRPERPEFVAKLEQQIPYYIMRHTVTPGFTGWAQIKFRYARTIDDSQEKFEYDLYHIKNRNLFLDIGIILKTAQIVFTHAGK